MSETVNWRTALPDKLRSLFIGGAVVIALAAALAPLVFLLRCIGVS